MKTRRKKHFVDSAVQGALVRRILLHWLIFLMLAGLMLPLWQLWSSGNIFSPFSTMVAESWRNTAPVFLALIALLPLFIWDTVTLTHRFAGPMHRFHGSIKSLAAGDDVPPIRLRKGDFWCEFAEDFNDLLERLAEERRRRDDQQPVGCAAPGGCVAPGGDDSTEI